MSLTLILMRHAKSSWEQPGDDRARVLNARGRRAATDLGAWLRRAGHVPDRALVSDAARTRETWERLRLEAEAEFLPGLYCAEAHRMLDILRSAGGARTVLMLGHNPGIAELAEALVETPPENGAFLRYPTGATTVIAFDAPGWSEVEPGTGRVVDFMVPRWLETAE